MKIQRKYLYNQHNTILTPKPNIETRRRWGSALMNRDCDDYLALTEIWSDLPWYYRLQFQLKVMAIVIRRDPAVWLWIIASVMTAYTIIMHPLIVFVSSMLSAFLILMDAYTSSEYLKDDNSRPRL